MGLGTPNFVAQQAALRERMRRMRMDMNTSNDEKEKSLDELLIIHGSDKATEHTRTYAKPHGYSVVMEKYFAPLRDKPIKFLEIGIGGGESARAWLDYFENAQIYGVDFVKDTNIFNQPGRL